MTCFGADHTDHALSLDDFAVAANPLDCVVDGTGICLENDTLNVTGNKKYI